MSAREKLNEFLGFIAPLLKEYGYVQKGQNFYIRKGGNWGLINFQKSVSSTNDLIKFQVNLGIYSTALARFFHNWKKGPPPILECHWRDNSACQPEQGYWWMIDETTALPHLVSHFNDLLPRAKSRIENYITDEALRDLYLSGNCGGLTNLIRLEHLSVLVKIYGPSDILDFILTELRNSGEGRVIDGHIARLRELKNT